MTLQAEHERNVAPLFMHCKQKRSLTKSNYISNALKHILNKLMSACLKVLIIVRST